MAPALAVTFLLASLILIPTSPHAIEVAATRRMLRHVERVRAERPDDPPGVLIVPNRVTDLGNGLEGYRDRLAGLGEELAPPLRQDGRFDQAFAERLGRGHRARLVGPQRGPGAGRPGAGPARPEPPRSPAARPRAGGKPGPLRPGDTARAGRRGTRGRAHADRSAGRRGQARPRVVSPGLLPRRGRGSSGQAGCGPGSLPPGAVGGAAHGAPG